MLEENHLIFLQHTIGQFILESYSCAYNNFKELVWLFNEVLINNDQSFKCFNLAEAEKKSPAKN